jgi:hypothetical protein
MKKIPGFLLLSVLGTAFLPVILPATPYWTPEDYEKYQNSIPAAPGSAHEPALIPRSEIPRTADVYALLYEYVQICDFLTSMQELDPLNPAYGGMHEGESADLWAIVQTDNTQEAIRVWSLYAGWSGDLDTYRDPILAAWIYTMNFPAYDEEGTDSDYYRVHNCGWGIVAEAYYRAVYGDSSFLWYADSCAAYIRTHRLPYTGTTEFYQRLHPLVEGWAAGTLYAYGIERGDSSAVEHALEVGSDVQAWLEANPNRLNNNEVWAMSGGTALWGVCKSVFAQDPAAGETWLPVYLPYMDVYAGPGQWNNAWNTWYAHAYHACAAVLDDSTCTAFAFALVDTLLDGDTDDDGGIPATSSDPPTMDQSWVSCYLNYMGLAPLIDQSPEYDAVALGFLLPDSLLPVFQGEPYEVKVLVGNGGILPFGNTNITISGAFTAAGSTFLEFADVDTPSLGYWTPSEPGFAQLQMTLSPGGAVSANDTITLGVNVLGWGEIHGVVQDQGSGSPIGAELAFYHDSFPPDSALFTCSTAPGGGTYALPVVEGRYRVVADPEIPYTDREISDVVVTIGASIEVDFLLTPAPVMLVDDDGGDSFETYYSIPLQNAGYDVYHWDTAVNEPPVSELAYFQALIWFTGDQDQNTLTATEQQILADFLDSGGSLLLTGQNIAEDLAGENFLTDYLGAGFVSASSNQMQVQGVAGDPVTSGLSLLLAGVGGAGNQTSTDILSAAGASSLVSMRYGGAAQPVAGVRIESPYKLIFLGFGLEGASGLGGTTTRQEFLNAVLQWFQVPTGVLEESPNTPPNDYQCLSLYPNPFNQTVQIRFTLATVADPVLRIYNLNGSLIEMRPLGALTSGIHSVPYRFPNSAGSGIYFFRIDDGSYGSFVKGILLK